MIWDIDDLPKKPEKTPLERAVALPLSPRMAKILGREPKRSLWWKDDNHIEAVPKDGKGKLVWVV